MSRRGPGGRPAAVPREPVPRRAALRRYWNPEIFSAMPSRSSIGKKSRAWLRVSQRAKPSRWAACFCVQTRAPTPTSGSLSMWLGLAWWRTCLSFHHASFIPSSRLACTRPTARPALRSPVIWACPASCPTNAVRDQKTASGSARSRFHQVLPRRTMPVITAPSAMRLTAMPAAYQPVRRSRRPCPFTARSSGAKSLPCAGPVPVAVAVPAAAAALASPSPTAPEPPAPSRVPSAAVAMAWGMTSPVSGKLR